MDFTFDTSTKAESIPYMFISFSNEGQAFPFSPVYGKFDALRLEWILHHSRHSQGKKPLPFLAMVKLS